MHAGGKAGRGQRSRQKIAVVDRKPNGAAIADVEIAVRRQKSPRFTIGRVRKAVDIMMTVALGMGDADQRTERKVLLHREPGLTGQVFARYEELVSAGAPLLYTSGIENRFVDALAGF